MKTLFMAVTLKKLAEFAGVSTATVSRALKNDPLIALSTRKRISELAENYDYVPSHPGRSLQSGGSSLVGFMVSSMQTSFYDDIMQGIGKVTCKNNYGLMVAVTEDNHRSETEQLKIFREKAVEGIIVSNYCMETIPYLRKIEESGIPLVMCDIESYSESQKVVRTSDEAAIKLIASHLAGFGHRKLGFCFNINPNSRYRYELLKAEFLDSGIPEPLLLSSKLELRSLILSGSYPTALVCYSDSIAVEVIQLLRNLDITVPLDVSVTGFDDILPASWPEFSITSIRQPKTGIGEQAAEILFRMIRKEPDVRSMIFNPKLIVRKSTGPARMI